MYEHVRTYLTIGNLIVLGELSLIAFGNTKRVSMSMYKIFLDSIRTENLYFITFLVSENTTFLMVFFSEIKKEKKHTNKAWIPIVFFS